MRNFKNPLYKGFLKFLIRSMSSLSSSVLARTSHNWSQSMGRSGGAMALGKLPVPGRPTIRMVEGKGVLHLQQVRVGVV